MAKPTVPKYRRQREAGRSDRAFVVLSGQKYHLGVFNSRASREAYVRAVGEWEAAGRQAPTDPEVMTVSELVARFWTFAEGYYAGPNRSTTSELETYKAALKPLAQVYGATEAAAFGPKRLRTVREKMIGLGWGRRYCNKQVGRIVRMFKWGASEELVPASIYHALQTLDGLRIGRSKAHESPPVLPVPQELFEAVLPHLPETVRAMCEVQRLAGMRPCEVCLMRVDRLDMSDDVWVFTPEHHKNTWRGRDRRVYLGPKAQAILKPFLRRVGGYMFSPTESEKKRRKAAHRARKVPLSCGNVPGSNVKLCPTRPLTDRYVTDVFTRAVRRACEAAFPLPEAVEPGTPDAKAWVASHYWSPGRLRHSFATEVRRGYGLESVQVALGHAHAAVSEVYAERDEAKARDVARAVG